MFLFYNKGVSASSPEKKYLSLERAGKLVGAKLVSLKMWCEQGEVEGAKKFGPDWFVPENTLLSLGQLASERRDTLLSLPIKQALLMILLLVTVVAGVQFFSQSLIRRDLVRGLEMSKQIIVRPMLAATPRAFSEVGTGLTQAWRRLAVLFLIFVDNLNYYTNQASTAWSKWWAGDEAATQELLKASLRAELRADFEKELQRIVDQFNTSGPRPAGRELASFDPSTGVVLVHKMAKRLQEAREKKEIKWLKPDGKTQITILNNKIATALVSTQHDKSVGHDEVTETVTKKIIAPIVGSLKGVEVLVNPTGSFVQGGFEADAGLTGRKIMVDTYGGLICHGGGAFSGKDLTKVDRSAAYMCRFVAKNIVANGYAKECLVSVAYAIGHIDPLMVHAIDEKGKSLASLVKKHFDFRPLAIIERLDLRKPWYQATAAYGHFGKKGLPWENIIKI